MKLNSISSLCGGGYTGTFSTIEYAEISTIDPSKWDYPSGARVDKLFTDDLFLPTYGWLKMPAIIKSKSLAGNVARSPQGEYVTAEVKVYIPYNNIPITMEMAKMKHAKMIIKVKLDDGTYLIGTPEYPLLFDFGFGTSPQAAGTKGYNCVWRGEMPNMMRALNPEI